MGQNRTDTANQLAAKQRVADSRKCPNCERRSALSTKIEIVDSFSGEHLGSVRTCLYCEHRVGIIGGHTFGRPSSEFATEAEADYAAGVVDT